MSSDTPLPLRFFAHRTWLLFAVVTALVLPPCAVCAEEPARRAFNIPADVAERTLKLFSEQSGRSMVVGAATVRGVRTNPVQGQYGVRDALERLIAGTGLVATHDEISGAFTVTRESSGPNGPRAAHTAGDRPVQISRTPGHSSNGDETVQLAAFVVDTTQDRGYAATNSISATKMNTPVKDLPFGITILNDDYIRDRSATTTQEAMAFTASYNVDNGRIRGLAGGNNRFRNGFGEFFGRHSLSSVERVEVLKGPSSVIYGITYPGGYVNPITKRPRPRDSYEFSTQAGWEGNYRILTDVNQSLGGAYEAAVRWSSEYRDVRSNVEFDSVINFVNHFAFSIRPWRRTEVLFDVEVLRSEGWEGTDWSLMTDTDIPLRERFGVPEGYSFNGPDVQAGDDNVIPMLKVTHAWSEQFTSELVVNHLWRANRRYDQNRFSSSIVNAPGTGRRSVRQEWQRITDDTRTWDYQLKNLYSFDALGGKQRVLVQLQLTEGTGGRTTFQRGRLPNGQTDFYYIPLADVPNYYALDRRKPSTLNYVTDPTQLNGYKRISRQLSLLHQGEFPLGPGRLHTIVGGNHYDYDARTAFPTSPTETNQQTKTLPTAGVAWALNPRWTLYALWSQSFNPNNRNDGFNRPLPPTEGDSIEGGFKVDLAGGRISGTLSAFRSLEQNRRVNDPEAPNINSFGVDPTRPIGPGNPVAPNSPKGADIAAGEFESTGVDAEAIFTPIRNWQVVASYLYSDALITKDPVATNIGRRDSNHATHTAALWTKYTFGDGVLKNLSLGGGYRWSTDRLRFYRVNSGVRTEYELPGSRRLDLYASYAVRLGERDLYFQANIENVAREKTYAGNRPGTTIPYAYELPVKWYVTAGLRF